ncbi:MAG: carbon-nitrogen hydrolase family protein [Alphaproteobacteria bacterium]|nr:carbon-nitrogen hydrolase family protein [Alphaproteobacteria bacterium]
MTVLPPLRAACVQFCATTDIAENLAQLSAGVAVAAKQGAQLVQLPEMANLMQMDKVQARVALENFSSAVFLDALQELALHHGVWLHVGSLIILRKAHFRNRGYVIDDKGRICAKYDKIHLFDVDLADSESYRESSAFRGGNKAVLVDTPWGKLGMTICFDLRFGALFRALAKAGATILTAPSAFTATTGAVHWHPLVCTRAIENGALMIACCQGGDHADGRKTYGHSLIVNAWGEVVGEGGSSRQQCVIADLDPNQPAEVRRMIPTLALERPFHVAHCAELS